MHQYDQMQSELKNKLEGSYDLVLLLGNYSAGRYSNEGIPSVVQARAVQLLTN